MNLGPGEGAHLNQEGPEQQLIRIHQSYEASGQPPPYPYLSPESYRALKQLAEKVDIERLDGTRWSPDMLVEYITYLDALRPDEETDNSLLIEYANELCLALEQTKYPIFALGTLSLVVGNSGGKDKDIYADLLGTLNSLVHQIEPAKEEIPRMLQRLEEEELVIGLGEHNIADIEAGVSAQVDYLMQTTDNRSIIQGRRLANFGLSDECALYLTQIHNIGQALRSSTDRQNEDYQTLLTEQNNLKTFLKRAIMSQKLRLINGLVVVRKYDQDTSKTERILNATSSVKQENDHREPSAILLSQLIALELLSRYISVFSDTTELYLVREASSSNGQWHAHDIVKPLISLDSTGNLVVESPGVEFRAAISAKLIEIKEALIDCGIDLQTLIALIKLLDEEIEIYRPYQESSEVSQEIVEELEGQKEQTLNAIRHLQWLRSQIIEIRTELIHKRKMFNPPISKENK